MRPNPYRLTRSIAHLLTLAAEEPPQRRAAYVLMAAELLDLAQRHRIARSRLDPLRAVLRTLSEAPVTERLAA